MIIQHTHYFHRLNQYRFNVPITISHSQKITSEPSAVMVETIWHTKSSEGSYFFSKMYVKADT